VSKKKYDRQVELAASYQDKYHAWKRDSTMLVQRIDSLLKDSTEMQKQIAELEKVNKSSSSVSPPIKYYRQRTISEEKEYKLKVIYLYNIASGIDWETKYKKDNFVIGVLGKSPITAMLNKELANKKKGSQYFSIIEFPSLKDITNCNVLFIAKGNYQSLNAIRNKVKSYPTLLISEEDYAAQGAHFNLAVDGDALIMSANRELLKKINVTVSKALLSSAE
jgi:hypothetical protein